jgi:hypothetical protein
MNRRKNMSVNNLDAPNTVSFQPVGTGDIENSFQKMFIVCEEATCEYAQKCNYQNPGCHKRACGLAELMRDLECAGARGMFTKYRRKRVT